jgi:two-component system, OmpR family, sensor histidine kinase PhoQ
MQSINARMTFGATVVLAIFVALSALALERAFRENARSARQERLLAQTYLLMAAAEVDAQGRLTIDSRPSDPRLELPGSGLYAMVVDGSGKEVWRSRSSLSVSLSPAAAVAPGEQRFASAADADGHGYFTQSYGVNWAAGNRHFPFTFRVAEDLKPFNDQLAIYRRSLWTWLGVAALLLLIAQWSILRWGLRPLRRVADELTRLEHGEQQQIAGNYPSEVSRLTDNLNSLLAQERAQRKRYREALADLAHSLKTPLALMRGAMREGEARAPLARTLEEQIERMDQIVAYQLQRAEASGRSRMSVAQPVRPVVERLGRALGKVYAAKAPLLDNEIGAEVRFRGDEGDLTELLGNVLDNAHKWCRSRIRVSASQEKATLALTVEDDGPGIEEADAERVLARGARADQSVPGHGIGLAVARDIVEAYDGRIVISRSALGGASVSVLLPAA